MEQEFLREHSWTDWKGKAFSLSDEYAYVMGPATPKSCTPGERDTKNKGMLPGHFLWRINNKIKKRRQRGYGTSLPEEHAYLTLDEVLAVRLYSGPAFQPINEFLRQIAWLSGDYRMQLAKHAGLTFTATIGNICRAIRKLAAITTHSENTRPLYRAVRGELPRSFWMPDEHGLVTATDTAFMSTSAVLKTPLEYMHDNGHNVLWEIRPEVETDSGFHRGADITDLSQFAAEQETLFPPCTMLRVLHPERHEQFPRWAVAAGSPNREATSGEKSAKRLRSSSSPSLSFGGLRSTLLYEGGSRYATLWQHVLCEAMYEERRKDNDVHSQATNKQYVKIEIEPTFI